jgi:hypothetical protein
MYFAWKTAAYIIDEVFKAAIGPRKREAAFAQEIIAQARRRATDNEQVRALRQFLEGL